MDEADLLGSSGPTGDGGAGRPGFPADPHRLQTALWRGRLWLIGAGGLGLIVGLLYVELLMASSYEANVVLKYEGDVRIGDQSLSSDAIGPAADALHRQSVLLKVRDELGFEGSATGLASWIEYEADPRQGTLEFSVSAQTGEDAARYARVVTDVFMDYHKERQSRQIDTKIARVEKRIDSAEDEAEEARRVYNEFREEHGITDLSTEQQSVFQTAAALRADGELATSDIRAVEAQVKSFEAQLASTPKTSFVSGGSSPEQAVYDRLRGELVSAKATLSPEHPRVQALQQQVDQLRAELRSTGGSSSRGEGLFGPNVTYQTVEGHLRGARSLLAARRERQKGLIQMADRAQQRVEGFSDIEGEALALLAEVRVNERLLLQLHDNEVLLEDALHDPPSGFVVLDPGSVPEYPVENKMKMVLVMAIPTLAVVLALLLVLRREFQGLLLKTPVEVAFWGKGPVLAATSWPEDLQGLDELVAGLDDFAPGAKGNMLVVGASPGEGQLARELADRLNNDWLPTQEPSVVPIGRGPLQTPPPSGPYPTHHAGNQASAPAQRRSTPPSTALRVVDRTYHLQLQAWDGPFEGQSLRRAARLADRVMIIVRSGAMSAPQLNRIQRRIGRERGVGYLVVGLSDEFRALPDRAGEVAGFWRC